MPPEIPGPDKGWSDQRPFARKDVEIMGRSIATMLNPTVRTYGACSPFGSFRRMGIHSLLILAACLLGLVLFSPIALGAKGDSRATLFVGTTTFSAGDTTTTGTTFGAGFGFEVVDNLMLTIGGSFSATDGEEIADDGTGTLQSYPVRTNTAALRMGATRFFNRNGAVIPYVGAGLSFLNYDIDHTYPNSELGKTSGTAPGIYGMGGLELRMTRNTTVILQYGVQSHALESETGESVGALSGGLSFSLRISA